MSTPTVATTKYAVRYRLLVGPRFRTANESYFWDWSTLNLDAAYTPAPAAVTLATSINAASTEVEVDSVSGWPTTAGFWVGPGAAGETWEYIEYGGVGSVPARFTNLNRETVSNEQSGTHSAGAAVVFWQTLSGESNRFDISESLDGNWSAIRVTASFTGTGYIRQILRNYHLCLVQVDWGDENLNFAGWTNAVVGWILEPAANDNAANEAQWQFTLGGISEMLALIPCKGLRVGPLNLAALSNASASQQLAKPYKEFHSGEFVGSAVNVGPSSAIDEDMDTLYVSEVFIGENNAIEVANVNKPDYQMPDLESAMAGLDQVHITRYTGQGPGYRWFQVHMKPGKDEWPKIYNKDNIYPDLGANDDVHTTQERVILCENKARFTEENPYIAIDPNGADNSGAQVIEINNSEYTLTGGAPPGMTIQDWWDSFTPSGGSVMCDKGGGWIAWGTYGGLPALNPGQTIMRDYSTGSAGSYYVTYASMPGYCMHQWMTLQHFYLAELAPLGLTLASDITAASPGVGDKLWLNSGSVPCTNGLRSSGSLMIGSEYIGYSAKTSGSCLVSARGTGGTAAAAHTANDPVYVYENGEATDGWPISSVTWKRKAGTPTIKQFWLYGSRYPIQPRTLGDGYWMYDYDQFVNVLNNTAQSYTYNHSGPNYRYRWASLIGERMATDPYRFMLNEFEVLADCTAYDPHQYLSSGSVYHVAREVLLGAGIPGGAILDQGDTPLVSNFTTSTQNVWSVLTDLMDMTGCFLETRRDGKLLVRAHSYWNQTTVTESDDWTRGKLLRFAFDPRPGRKVGQVALSWEALDKSTRGTVYYPTTRDTYGEVVRIGPWRYANKAAAQAAVERLYWAQRAPYAVTMDADGAPWDLRPGVIHGASWDFGGEAVGYDRTHILDRVDHRIENGGFETAVHALQIERSDET